MSIRMIRNAADASFALASAFVLTLLVGGCGPSYDHTDITAVTASPLGGGLDKSLLTVPEGLVVTAHIESKDDDGKAMGLSLRALDPTIVQVSGVVNAHDYAFVGLRAGTTQIAMTADGVVVLTVDAEVLPQPAPTE